MKRSASHSVSHSITASVQILDDALAAERRAPETGDAFAPGRLVARRYRIVRLVGRGGMGEVYQAEDLRLSQDVALKCLPRGRHQDSLRRELLLNEVRLARRISHPNVCQVHDVAAFNGILFLSMEYVKGESLAELLKRIRRLPEELALRVGVELCRGLAAAHDCGILHRDLKPANLMLDAAGHLRIADFGLAWIFGDSTQTSSPSPTKAGTPAYMAPEQRAGETATVKSDLYALGLVLYEVFTGRRPCADDPAERPEPPSLLAPGLDPEIERIVLRCLEPDPQRRPPSAGDVAEVLERRAIPPWRPEPGVPIPSRPSWTLEEKLGEGGFGEVWLAIHGESPGDQRVFKFCRQAHHLQALQREITLFRLLREELGERRDIQRILDWNFDQPPWFIEAEHTAEGNLAQWAESRGGLARIPLETRLEIVAQVATALGAAHSIGVLHKDVKPSNVLVRRGSSEVPEIQLADFGIGAVLETKRLEQAGITVLGFTERTETTPSSQGGTPLYMAPEILEGKPATLKADVYALGILLYQVVVADFTRALAPGWQRDVADELLREDIAAAVDGAPERRLGDAAGLAERLRTLVDRRAERRAQRRQQAEDAAARAALENSRRRRRVGALVLAAATGVAALSLYQARLTRLEAARAKNIARVAIAAEWLAKDPTRAALVLLEVEEGDVSAFVDSKMREALRQELALFELRHDEFIRSIAWSPDGSQLLTASWDTTARIWDAATGRAVRVLEGHRGELMEAVWSPDGRRVATASRDDTARIWNVDDPADVRVLDGHTDNVQSIAWSGDGSRLVTTSRDTTARIWDGRDGTALGVLRGHENLVEMAAWSPDGERLFTVSYDGTARLWNVPAPPRSPAAEVEPRLLASGDGFVWKAVWHPSGTRVAIAANWGTALVRIGEEGPLGEPELLDEARARAVAWDPSGRLLAAALYDGTLRIWRDDTGAPLVLEGHKETIWEVSWSPDGTRLLTTSQDRTARVWPIRIEASSDGGGRAVLASEPVVLRGHGASVEPGAWSPDGTHVATASGDRTARIWRPGSAGAELVFSEHGAAVRSVALSGDGLCLLTASSDGTARLRPTGLVPGSKGCVPRVLEGHSAAVHVAAWSPDGRRILTASEDGTARIWSAGTERPPAVLEGHEGAVTHAAWSGDGTRVLTASRDGTARIRMVGDDGRAAPDAIVLGGHGDEVRMALWSPDSRRVASVSGSTAYLWDVSGPQPQDPLVLDRHTRTIYTATWSGDGRYLATVSEDGKACIWNLNGVEVRVLDAGEAHPMWSVAWSPDGTYLLTGQADSRVLVWELGEESEGTARPIALEGHNLLVEQIAFAPDGERFATKAKEERVLLWDLAAIRRARSTGAGSVRPHNVLEGHTGRLERVSWSADGRHLATASLDGTARVWHLDLGELRGLLQTATRLCLDPEFREDVLGDAFEQAHRRWEECERSRGRISRTPNRTNRSR